MIRQANKQDISRIAEIIVFGKRVAYRPIFENDYVSFNELQVVRLYEEYKNNPDRLDGMLLYDDGIIKGIINGHSIGDKIVLWVIKDNIKARKFYEDNGFVNSGKICIIEGTTKEDCCYEYVLE